MESTSVNEEELLSDKLQKVGLEYSQNPFKDENRQNLLRILQSNDCRELIAKCVDGDNLSNSFVKAAYGNHVEILQSFLDNGINIDIQNRTGWTALMSASYCGYKEIVQLLLHNNGDIDLRNNAGETALDLAQTNDIKEMFQNHVNTSYVLK